MSIDATRLKEIFIDCLYREEELTDHEAPPDAVMAEGVVTDAGFNPVRLEQHRDEIVAMIHEWPIEFFPKNKGGGDGWSFLNAPTDKDGNLWGQQRNAEQLMLLGIALGKVKVLLPREQWPLLPGGVPYFIVVD